MDLIQKACNLSEELHSVQASATEEAGYRDQLTALDKKMQKVVRAYDKKVSLLEQVL